MKNGKLFFLAGFAAALLTACFSPYLDEGGMSVTFGDTARAAFDFSPENIARLTHTVVVRSGDSVVKELSGIQGGETIDIPLPAGTYDAEVRAYDGERLVAENTAYGVVVQAGVYTNVTLTLLAVHWDEEPEPGNEETDTGDEEYPVIARTLTITTTLNGNLEYFALAGEGEAAIDWGDGTGTETVTLEELPGTPSLMGDASFPKIPHTYATGGNKTITVTGSVTGVYTGASDTVSALDTSGMPGLIALYCGNENLTTLDVSKNSAPKVLVCNLNGISALDTSRNTALIQLNCADNELTRLDVGANSALQYLDCSTNPIDTLSLDGAISLLSLDCSDNSLDTLGVGTNTALTLLVCSGNDLTSFSVSGLENLEYANCRDNLMNRTALGALFGTLHDRRSLETPGTIDVTGNTGSDGTGSSDLTQTEIDNMAATLNWVISK